MKINSPNIFTSFFLNISVFRVAYITCLFLNSFIFFNPIGVLIIAFLMIWSVFIIYFYYIKNRRIFKILYGRWLFLYIAVCLLTAIVHLSDNFLINLYYIFQMSVCFFIFYGMHTEKNKKRIKKELYYEASIIVIITTVVAICSIPLIFFSNGFDIDTVVLLDSGFTTIKQHFLIYENRFTGFYTNPNILAFCSVVSIVFAHILSKSDFVTSTGKKQISRSLLIISAIINLLCLFLSDSNSSLVLIIFYIISLLIFKIFGGGVEFTFKQIFIKSLAVLVAVIILLPTALIIRTACKTGITAIISTNSITQENSPIENIEDDFVSFTHENKNIDSGRLTLLSESVAIIEQYPLLGIGRANLVDYGNKYIEGGFKFNDLHNGYLTILVCSGIVGLTVFIGFAVHILKHSVFSLFLEKKNLSNSAFPCVFSFVFAYAIFAVLEKTILNEQTFMVVIFWSFLGILSRYMLKYNHIDDKFKIKSLINRADTTAESYDVPTEEEI